MPEPSKPPIRDAAEHKLLSRLFEVLIHLLSGLGFAIIALAATISSPIVLGFAALYLPIFNQQLADRLRLSQRRSNQLTWAYLPVFLLDVLSDSFIPATLHLILFVQLIKLYQSREPKDYLYLFVLSFLEVLAASSMTIESWFLFLFSIYLLICLAALITFEIKQSLARAYGRPEKNNPEDGQIGCQDLMVERVARHSALEAPLRDIRLAWAIPALSLVTIFCAIIMGSALFFTIPRFGSGYFGRLNSRSSTLSGFSETIRLGSIGRIQLNPSIVMRVHPEGDFG